MTERTVAIIGAGIMGAGIAQVAATHGWTVHLADVSEDVARKAIDSIGKQLDRLVEKEKLSPADCDAAKARLHATVSVDELAACELIIEAVVEKLDVKNEVLRPIAERMSGDAIIATNTSSLSITKLGEAIGAPERTIGFHFFNPAPVLKLVEVVAGAKTDLRAVERAATIAREWSKTPVIVKDTPGFIVNRVARPFYLESWRLLEEGIAGVVEIDAALRKLGGFRMGPFELTDMIGQDVNAASSRSVWEQLGRPARLAPSRLQEQLVAEGRLGRKAGRGAYSYANDPPIADMSVERKPLVVSDSLLSEVDAFVSRSAVEAGLDVEQYIFARVLVSVINEAAWTVGEAVASEDDIDTAMKLATNYPAGPLEWAGRIGHDVCTSLLEALNAGVDDKRFTPAPKLLP